MKRHYAAEAVIFTAFSFVFFVVGMWVMLADLDMSATVYIIGSLTFAALGRITLIEQRLEELK